MWRGRALLGVVGNPATGGGGVSWLLPPPLLLMGGRSADSYHPSATPGLYFMVWTSSSRVCAAYWEKLAGKCVCIHSTEGIYLFLIFICLAWKTREILDSVIWYDRSAAQKQVTPNTASVWQYVWDAEPGRTLAAVGWVPVPYIYYTQWLYIADTEPTYCT